MSNPESNGQSHPTAVFAPSPRPRLSAGSAIAVLFAIALMLGGFYAMAIAFSVHEYAIPLFAGGLLLEVIGFWFTFGWLPGRER